MLRTLIHYRRVQAAVVLGAAVTTAVLTGALLVGDSVRGSLRDLTLDRLGAIGAAMVRPLPFRVGVADELSGAVPALILNGAAVHGDGGARASRVAVIGIDDRFGILYPDVAQLPFDRTDGQLFPSAILNESLARELGAVPGDAVVLSFNRFSDIPRATLMGEDQPEDVRDSLRVAVRAIIPDRGPGRFGLVSRQQRPLNAFVELRRLARAIGRRGEANTLLLHEGATPDVATADRALADVLTLDDLGLVIRERGEHVTVESDAYVLSPAVADAVRDVAAGIGAPSVSLYSYLANRMEVDGRDTPYSMVTAVDIVPTAPADSSLVLEDGRPAPEISPDGILLNRWAVDDLGARVGDPLTLTYYRVGDREELIDETARFRVEGIVAFTGLAADREQSPDYPGLSDAADIASWDPPFPVDLDRIRPKDEAYWDEHGPTPKAYVAAATGRRLWGTRYGDTTQIRVGAVPVEELETALRSAVDPATQGFRFRDVRAEGLRAASGATDFSGLFIGFSLFLIVSAALLVGLLFGLGIEGRGREIGLRLAAGFRLRAVRRRLLLEGLAVATAGAVVGLAGAVGYAALMMAGLRTLWVGAVGSSELYLHVSPMSLVLGAVISVGVVMFAIWMTVRRLSRVPTPTLLAGSVRTGTKRTAGRVARILAWGGTIGAVALVGIGVAQGTLASAGLAFGTGALMLVAGLAWFALWCRAGGRGMVASRSGMAARNSAWNPGRSLLSVALVASATFVIVVVAANRVEFGDELHARDSGTGGFALVAEADIAIHQDLDRVDDLRSLGMDDEAIESLADTTVYLLRLLPGDDASCLNLYRPESPRVLGVPDDVLDRGGFTFKQVVPLPAGAETGWDLLRERFEADLDLAVDGDPHARVVPAIADFNSAMWILHHGLGDDVVIEDEFGEPLRLRLVGLLDTSILQSEVLIPDRAFRTYFPGRSGFGYFLIDAPFDDADVVAGTLEGALGPFGFDATGTTQRLESYKEVEHTYLSTFQVLGGFGLLLGTVGLGIVMVRNVLERRGELATLRAFGFRTAELRRLVLAENAFLLGSGIAIGAVSALAAVAPRLADLHVPWGSLAAILGTVVVVGMLASVAALRAVTRVPLLPALKEER